MTTTILTYEHEWELYNIAYDELNNLYNKYWIPLNHNIGDDRIYAILLDDINENNDPQLNKKNMIGSRILNKNIYGRVLFVNYKNLNFYNLTQSDIFNVYNDMTDKSLNNLVSDLNNCNITTDQMQDCEITSNELQDNEYYEDNDNINEYYQNGYDSY
jgi:hypothetical protein